MNKNHLRNSILTAFAELLLVTTVQAGNPLWTFAQVPGYSPSITVSVAENATVKYTVTNQSHKQHTLRMKPIQGITASGCTSPLRYHQSCILNLNVNGSALIGHIVGGPVLCEHGNPLQCYQPSQANSLNITKGEATRFYVNGSKSINGNGSSWSNAFNNLQSALEAAAVNSGFNEIWVATGVYKPSKVYTPQGVTNGACGTNCGNTPNPNLRTFNLPSNTAIYGGFSGKETDREQRNGKLNPTILCGDMTSNCFTPYVPKSGDNRVWHVLMAGSDVPPGAGVKNVKLDTLIVRGGYANGPDDGVLGAHNVLVSLEYEHAAGGGLLARYGSTIELRHMLFDQNISDGSNATVGEQNSGFFLSLASGGGAVAAIDSSTLILIQKSTFVNNNAVFQGDSGGALGSLIHAAYTITSSQFEQNTAFRNGGAIRAKNGGDINISSSHFENNAVKGAFPDASGGAVGVIDTNLSISDSTFTKNLTTTTGFGGGAVFFHIPFNDGIPYFLNVENSKFTSNVGLAFGGGAINVFGATPNPNSKANITNSKFINNTGGVGGAIYADSIATKITKSDFDQNTAQLEGGAIFAVNYGNAVLSSSTREQTQIFNNIFSNNAIIGVPGPGNTVLNFFNIVANMFSNNSISVTAMAPGGGAIAVVFFGDAKIFDNTFRKNTALKKPLEEDNRGGAILVGGTEGTTNAMYLAHACVSSNVYLDNKANIDNNIALYNPGNIPDGVTINACIPMKK